jgi:hypothetical protein
MDQTVKENLVSALVSLTKSAKFLSPNEVSFIKSDKKMTRKLNEISEQVLSSINNITLKVQGTELFDGIQTNVVEDFSLGVEFLDNLYEKVVYRK